MSTLAVEAAPPVAAFDLHASVAFLIGSSGKWVSQRFNEELKHLGVTPVEWFVCASLLHRPCQRLSDVASQLPIDASTLSRTVEKLKRRGLLVSERRPNDRRSISLALTDAGVVLTERGIDLVQEFDKTLLHGIDTRQMKPLHALLSQVHGNARQLISATDQKSRFEEEGN